MRGLNVFPDPLQQLFEHHLLHKSYEDAEAFTKEVAKQYLSYIDATLAHVPIHIRSAVIEDLESEAHEMLIKKMYGVGSETENSNFGRVIELEPKRKKLKAIDFYLPSIEPESEPNHEPDER